ncbi:MAG: SDR family oxidoreductase [Blastocatellia bacterium]|nr:SDR family oxidoreductase [Blastocatellia bacterium]
MNHHQKIAIVTGAARGIGLAITNKFLTDGYSVALIDRDTETLAQTAASLSGQPILAVDGDVSEPQQVQSAIAQIAAHFGRIDVLVNNAGVAVFKPALEVTFEEWSQVMATNLNGPFLCTQACVPVMLKTGGGSVVNIASISGVRASTLRIAYGTSKAALMHLTKQQAVEYGNVGIRVNCIAPGPVETAMAAQVHSADIRTSYRDAIPLARYGTVDEIAHAVAFLCSDAASFINGQILAVDGGFDAAGVGLPSLRGTM